MVDSSRTYDYNLKGIALLYKKSINWRRTSMVKVSVIVPVYNQEKFIERCIDSILAQSMQEIEVILVDDGSTDSTPDILSRYEQKDNRITVLHQQNQYAGIARNHGLQVAQGEYVIFWDSDDYFPEDALEALYNESQKCDADICVGEATKMDMYDGTVREKCYINWSRVPEKSPFNINDIPQYIFNFARNYPWNRLYKKSFLEEQNLQFSELKQSNDVSFVMKAFVLAKKIVVIDKIIVYYQFRIPESLSGNPLNKKENVLRAHMEVKEFLIETGYWENQDIRQSFVNNAFATIASQFSLLENRDEYKVLYYFYKEKALPALEIGSCQVEQMYFDKNAYDLSHMLSCDAEEFVFKQFLYYLNRTQQFRNRVVKLKDKLEKVNDKNQRQIEKIINLKQDKENKIEIIKKQREKIDSCNNKIQKQNEKIEKQNEKIEKQSEKIQKQTEKIQRETEKIQRQSDRIEKQSEKIQKQSERIEKQSEKISSQKALLETKPVKVALKIHSLYK